MGGKEVVDDTPYPQQIIKYLNDLCAYALSIGMTYKEYWEDDPFILNHYVEAEKIKQRKMNNQLWLQGYYVYTAIGSLSPILNAFSKEHKARPYMKEPIPLTEEEKQEQAFRKEQKLIAYLDSLVDKKVGG